MTYSDILTLFSTGEPRENVMKKIITELLLSMVDGRGGRGTWPPSILKISVKKFFLGFEWEKTNFTTFTLPKKF